MTTRPTNCWLQVAGDIVPVGGMDSANFALARHLAADPAIELHLVSHHVAPELAAAHGVRLHPAWRPFGSHVLGAPVMRRVGRRWAARLAPRGVRIVTNGGNCDAGDVTWVHYVHAAYTPVSVANPVTAAKDRWRHAGDLAHERSVVGHARLVVCNSGRTQTDVVERLGVPPGRTRVVYYGIDAARFGLVAPAERLTERRRLGWARDRTIALFIGGLSDRRKGFDTLFTAWCALCGDPSWDGDLVVVGVGAERAAWEERARAAGVGERIRFLGHRTDVAGLLGASDVLVHPVRYEAYGLGVHEAICRGRPAIVSGRAGIAERYPADLEALLLSDPDSPDELAARLRDWRSCREAIETRVAAFGHTLRSRSWADMAREIVSHAESVP